jgi:hypothetical protein
MAQEVAAMAGNVGLLLTLIFAISSFRTTLRDSYYAELDRIYFDLLQIALEHPELLDYATSPDPGKTREYDAYAFMVWNFVETVYDRSRGWSKRRLRETWYPVIETEAERHRAWFDEPRNRRKFKTRFCDFIDETFPVPSSRGAAAEGSRRGGNLQ